MMVQLDAVGVPMKLVYRLSEELDNDPGQVAAAQALSLDATRPYVGLKGTHGLFGSPEWWANIESGVIPKKRLSGVIARVYVAGQEHSDVPNTFDLRCGDGSVIMEGIYVNSQDDVALYQLGRQVEIVYALDELKMPSPDGGKDYLEIVLEVSVSS